ncbi:hypothetical protein CHUAL_006883 [Chamberlinius hualienensis]
MYNLQFYLTFLPIILAQVIYVDRPPSSATACFQLPTKSSDLTQALGSKYFLYKSLIPDCDCCWMEYLPQFTNATYGIAEFHNGKDYNMNNISMQEVDAGIYVRANVQYPHETDLVRMLDFDYNQDNGFVCTYTCNMDGITTEDLMCHGTSKRSIQRIENVLMKYYFIFPKYAIVYNAAMCVKTRFGNDLFDPVYYHVPRPSVDNGITNTNYSIG